MKTFTFMTLMCIFLVGNSDGLTDDEIREKFTKLVMICSKDYKVEMQDLMGLQQLIVPTKRESKCLLACAYKKFGTMNKEGMYDSEAAIKIAEMATSGDPKRFENSKKLVNICEKVNDEKVSDGENGCDRASLMFKCFVENAPKLGFKIQ